MNGRRRKRRRDGRRRERPPEEVKEWIPKTDLGNRVLKGEFKSLEDLLKKGLVILEPEIVDTLVPDLKQEVIFIGGSPGKGGGIRRTATKRTARMHKSGRRFKLTAIVVIGDEKGIVGLGKASSREHRTAMEKATMNAKLNVIRTRKGCGSWECWCGGEHSVPFRTDAKEGSVVVQLLPAPKGVGIVASQAPKKIISLSGIKDVWVRTSGHTRTRGNVACTVFKALQNLNRTKGDL